MLTLHALIIELLVYASLTGNYIHITYKWLPCEAREPGSEGGSPWRWGGGFRSRYLVVTYILHINGYRVRHVNLDVRGGYPWRWGGGSRSRYLVVTYILHINGCCIFHLNVVRGSFSLEVRGFYIQTSDNYMHITYKWLLRPALESSSGEVLLKVKGFSH